MPPVAHAADWISVMFFIPVIAFMGWLAITQYRERRAQRDSGSDGDGPLG